MEIENSNNLHRKYKKHTPPKKDINLDTVTILASIRGLNLSDLSNALGYANISGFRVSVIKKCIPVKKVPLLASLLNVDEEILYLAPDKLNISISVKDDKDSIKIITGREYLDSEDDLTSMLDEKIKFEIKGSDDILKDNDDVSFTDIDD